MTTPRTKPAKHRPAVDHAPPPHRQVERELANARARLRAGDTLRAVLRDLRRRAAQGHLHPRTPEHVATVLRLDPRTPATHLLSAPHHEVLGVEADVGDPDLVDAACAEVLRLCRPSQFSSPLLRRLMEDVCQRARDAREYLFFGEVEPGDDAARRLPPRERGACDGRRDGVDEHDALVAALTAPLPPVAEPSPIAEPAATATARADLGMRSA